MKRQGSASEDKPVTTCSSDTAGSQRPRPELLTVEVANIQGEIVVLHSKDQDGSALEAASELHKLTEVLSEKAEEMKTLANQAFLGEAATELDAIPAAENGALDQLQLPTPVQEAVKDLREKIAQVHTAAEQPASAKQAADHAEALDQVAEVLESSSAQIKDLKVALTAKELNNMDGFDR